MKKLLAIMVALTTLSFGSVSYAQNPAFFWEKRVDNWKMFGFRGNDKLNAACIIASPGTPQDEKYLELVFDLTDAEVSLRVSYKKWNMIMPPGLYGVNNDKKVRISFSFKGVSEKVEKPFALLPKHTIIIPLDIDKIMEAPSVSTVSIKTPFSPEVMDVQIEDSKSLFRGLTECIRASGKPKKKSGGIQASRNQTVVHNY